MPFKHENQDAISEVFLLLGLEAAEERERLRLLASLGCVGEEARTCVYESADTRDNTAMDDEHAQLEPAS